MNRLVIVGNGFDLAHGLPTGYCDFIDWYWSNVFMILNNPYQYIFDYEDELIKFDFNLYSLPIQMLEDFRTINNHLDYIKFVQKCSELRINTEGLDYIDFTKNSFFQIINNRHHIQNWVDIENEYFQLLKMCLKEIDNNSQVKKLNQEFEQVKNLLEKYLNDKINQVFDFKHTIDLLPIISFFGRISNENTISNLFLNFNYTKTIDTYIDAFNEKLDNVYRGITQQIQIHGKLNDSLNKINFGFGDEMDDAYKTIENKDDNEYLKNIKSFQYLQNSNYKNMLNFIDSKAFQVYIMGHSCGLSDRILLNKIFEHQNCRSIKVFYHQFDEPKADGRTDNYTEIVQNISRHFNKKEMMRERILDKTRCQPLPQTVRFFKKENGSQS